MTLEKIKSLGKNRSAENLDILLKLYGTDLPIELKREVVSSIGRQHDNKKIYEFINNHVFDKIYMELIYQMYRTVLYKSNLSGFPEFKELEQKIRVTYDNEVINKMKRYYDYKQQKNHKNQEKEDVYNEIKLNRPALLRGDSKNTLKNLPPKSINLIFTSPPYYNARMYSDYNSYAEYLKAMKEIIIECNRILEDGRFIIINISPVITKRPGREFESIRYPIHFDFHNLLQESGFYFIDEIIWIKPETTVPNRIGGYLQTKKPLSYKPNCITESVLVYRKEADFLLDKNIDKYSNYLDAAKINDDNDDNIDTTNCWYISPTSNKYHPAVFPEELCEKVIKYYSFENDIVLDPFAGTGTFGKVAARMGRIPILCEINKDYIDIIERELINCYEI